MTNVVRVVRTVPWRQAARDSFDLRPMLLDQFRHEDFREARVLDVGTGEGRLAFVAARLGARVIGVDIDKSRLMQARSYAGVRNLPRVDFVHGDAEASSYREFSSEPFDFVISNLCMSPAIVSRSSQALRRGGKMIFCCHHSDNWRETKKGSRWSFSEDAMEKLLAENAFDVEFMGVDTTTSVFENLREVELFLRGSTVRKWRQDGRWEALADSFGRGEKRLTDSYLIVKARRRS